MKIALVGYGKMGKAIEEIALQRSHEIVLRITSANSHELNKTHLSKADVVIEFTNPDVAQENVMQCLAAGVSVVCGTTGWNDELPEAEKLAQKMHLAFLHASNFSIGVNIFFEINQLLASMMNAHDEYSISIEETHHTQKKDAPSGTAITLAEQILNHIGRKKTWALNFMNDANILPIVAHRVENVPGTHVVKYSSDLDEIEMKHTAHSRKGFALGAVLAAEFIDGKEGVFSMKDVING